MYLREMSMYVCDIAVRICIQHATTSQTKKLRETLVLEKVLLVKLHLPFWSHWRGRTFQPANLLLGDANELIERRDAIAFKSITDRRLHEHINCDIEESAKEIHELLAFGIESVARRIT